MVTGVGAGGSKLPATRRRAVNRAPWRPDRGYVLYWMTMARRLDFNPALERAVELARTLDRPLVILEPLRLDYPWASHRFHRFLLDGMREHRDRLRAQRVSYYPYVERAVGEGRGLLDALARGACGIIADDYPAFFLPGMTAAAGRRVDVRLEAVDGNGLLPVRAADRTYPTAYAFRRFLHRALPDALREPPGRHPLQGAPLARATLPPDVTGRWPLADRFLDHEGALAELPIPDTPGSVSLRGGTAGARSRLQAWLEDGFTRYAAERHQPLAGAASGLSPWLHFGHLAAWEVAAAVMEREAWNPGRLGTPSGARHGWWGMSEPAEALLDELVTWRELGFNHAVHDRGGWTTLASLPHWARRTLEDHSADRREWTYTIDDLAEARTHDPVWNAAQRELAEQGTLENYLRMLWGKKILEWSADSHEALETMVELNNRFALDGRDPNSWSGMLWCLGKFDRPWGPERPVFGTVRYMSSASARRKLRLGAYLSRFGTVENSEIQLEMV